MSKTGMAICRRRKLDVVCTVADKMVVIMVREDNDVMKSVVA